MSTNNPSNPKANAPVTIVGAGFAGVEAAWALAERGTPARLYEMRPAETSPAHTTAHFAELVCSNSFKSMLETSPAGLLKEEMVSLGSICIKTAGECRVPGGEALCVDREKFGARITKAITSHPLIEVCLATWNPDLLEPGATTVLTTGPLSTDNVSAWLAKITGRNHLFFYDAVSPTVEASSINREVVFAQSRYDKGGNDYLNCPFDKDSYELFVRELIGAERVPLHAFETGGVRTGGEADATIQSAEKVQYFAGCTPIEAIAERGVESLRFGNFKPVGLVDPRTGRRPYAALQLRPENSECTLYSLVACQNRLRFGEQRRLFRLVPGLEEAQFVRYGVIHRNTYVDSPSVLNSDLSMRACPQVIIAGQLSGVEGYVESAAMGILAGLVAHGRELGEPFLMPPRATALGSLLSHLQDLTDREFAPMNINWGLLPEPSEVIRSKDLKRAKKLELARAAHSRWMESVQSSGMMLRASATLE